MSTLTLTLLMPLVTIISVVGMGLFALRCWLRAKIATRQRSELEATRAALAETENYFRQVIDHAPVTVTFRDLEGRYKVANPLLLKWLDLEADDLIGRRITDVFPQPLASDLVAYDEAVISARRPLPDEREVSYPDGRKRHMMGMSFPAFDEGGEVIGVGTIGVDISDLKAAERRIEQSQRMEAVGQLTGGVSHDFNNLLTVVRGSLELLSDDVADKPDAARRLAMALKAVDRGSDLTQRLLSFARQQNLRPSSDDIGKAVGHVSDLLRRTLRGDIALSVELADDIPPIMIDEAQLDSAIVNLAMNAQEAMPDGGTLVIKAWCDWQREDLCIALKDTGLGIRSDLLDRVCEPFFTTKTFGEGAGLGLSMAYGFAKQSGGALAIDSEPGRGTTVTLRFPVRQRQRVVGHGVVIDQDRTGPLNILLVEDDPEVRAMTADMVRLLGHNVVSAETGAEALELFEDWRPRADLVLTDWILPGGVSGPRIVEGLRAIETELPAIVMSGYTEDAQGRVGELPRDVVFLAKPFSRDQLSEAIDLAVAAGVQPLAAMTV